MSELIEMPYGNGKALTREFIKKYEEVQLDVEMKRKQCRKACFVNYHYSGRCDDIEVIGNIHDVAMNKLHDETDDKGGK